MRAKSQPYRVCKTSPSTPNRTACRRIVSRIFVGHRFVVFCASRAVCSHARQVDRRPFPAYAYAGVSRRKNASASNHPPQSAHCFIGITTPHRCSAHGWPPPPLSRLYALIRAHHVLTHVASVGGVRVSTGLHVAAACTTYPPLQPIPRHQPLLILQREAFTDLVPFGVIRCECVQFVECPAPFDDWRVEHRRFHDVRGVHHFLDRTPLQDRVIQVARIRPKALLFQRGKG